MALCSPLGADEEGEDTQEDGHRALRAVQAKWEEPPVPHHLAERRAWAGLGWTTPEPDSAPLWFPEGAGSSG